MEEFRGNYPSGIRWRVTRMRNIATLLLCTILLGCDQDGSVNSRHRHKCALKELEAADTTEERFYALNDAAKESFTVGQVEDAQTYAHELMTLLPQFQGNWNYGNAVQDANLVLGRIAVREGHIDDAKMFLIEAGKSPGSPQMSTFGPDMSLAKDLLEKGEREIALEYFELCRKFWRTDDGRLAEWNQQVKDRKIPEFGANFGPPRGW